MYFAEVCAAVQHTNAMRTTSLPDVRAHPTPSFHRGNAAFHYRARGTTISRDLAPHHEPWLSHGRMILARALWLRFLQHQCCEFLSFLKHQEKAPGMPTRVLLLLKNPNTPKLKPVERNAGPKDKHPCHTQCAWLQMS